MFDPRSPADLTAALDRFRTRHPRILVIGDVMLDRYLYVESSGRPNPECPDRPIRRCLRQEERLGGAAAVAAMCVALGATVVLAGGVGDDLAGLTVRALLDDAGIRHDVRAIVSQETTVKTRIVTRLADGGEEVERIDRNAPPRTHPYPNVEDFWTGVSGLVAQRLVDVVLVSDYGQGLLDPRHPFLRRLLVAARVAGVPTLVDPSRHCTDWDRYRGAWLVKANLAEYRALDGVARAEARATFPAIVVTAGERGLWLRQGHRFEVFRQATPASKPVDVCGAGDQVLATLGCLLAAGVGRATACDLANRAGRLAVGRRGTQPVLLEELASDISAGQ